MLLDMIQTQVQNKSFSHLRTIGQHSGQDVRLVSVNGGLCSMYTERVSNDLRHMKSSQLQNLAQVLSQRVMYIESSIKSLAVCMPHMDKQCPYFICGSHLLMRLKVWVLIVDISQDKR